MAFPSLAKLTVWLMYGGGWLVFATILATLVVARFSESIGETVLRKLKRAARGAYGVASLMFSSGLLCSLLVEVTVGRSSQTSRAGGTLTVYVDDSPFLFWLTVALKGVAVLFVASLAIKVWKDPKFD